MKVCILSLWLLMLFNSYTIGQGHFSLNGDIEALDEFSEILIQSARKSKIIEGLIQDIRSLPKDEFVTIRVIDQGSVEPVSQRTRISRYDCKVIDTTVSNCACDVKEILEQVITIDLGTLRKFPTFQMTKRGKYQLDHGPPWAISIETLLAHELAEYLEGKRKDDFNWSRDHPEAVKIENAVRKGFGQKALRITEKSGTFKKSDGTKVTGWMFQLGRHREIWEYDGSKFIGIHYD